MAFFTHDNLATPHVGRIDLTVPALRTMKVRKSGSLIAEHQHEGRITV